MKKNFTLLILTALQTINCFGQSQFQIAIGGTNDEWAKSIIQTTDGGYAVAGATQSFGAGNNDMYIVKLASTGSFQWSKTVGGTNDDRAYSIVQTIDGGYAVAGYTWSFGSGNDDIYIVKLASTGSLQWSKTVGGTSEDWAFSIIQTTDGGYAIAGGTFSFGAGGSESDMYIVKLASDGSLQWSKTVGGTSADWANSIIQTTDGGYAVAGQTISFGTGFYDMYIVKLASDGSLQWSKTVGGTNDDVAYSIIQTTDGGYALAGETESFGAGYYDMYIVKLASTGSLQWSKTVGGTSYDYAQSIIQTIDGGYAITGETESFGAGGFDMYIVKLASTGSFQWSKTVGGPYDDWAYSIIQTTDGGYAVTGSTSSFGAGGMYIVKLDANGNTCGNSSSPSSITGTGGTETSPSSTVTTPNPTVTTPSPTVSSGGTVTTICSNIGIKPISSKIPNSFSLYQNYPNPFNPVTKIKYDVASPIPSQRGVNVKLIIYDILGREVTTLVNERLQAGSYEVEWDASNYPSGVYFYRLTATEFTETKKLILLK